MRKKYFLSTIATFAIICLYAQNLPMADEFNAAQYNGDTKTLYSILTNHEQSVSNKLPDSSTRLVYAVYNRFLKDFLDNNIDSRQYRGIERYENGKLFLLADTVKCYKTHNSNAIVDVETGLLPTFRDFVDQYYWTAFSIRNRDNMIEKLKDVNYKDSRFWFDCDMRNSFFYDTAALILKNKGFEPAYINEKWQNQTLTRKSFIVSHSADSINTIENYYNRLTTTTDKALKYKRTDPLTGRYSGFQYVSPRITSIVFSPQNIYAILNVSYFLEKISIIYRIKELSNPNYKPYALAISIS